MDEAASLAKQKSDLEDEYMYFSDIYGLTFLGRNDMVEKREKTGR